MNNEMNHEDGKDAEVDAKSMFSLAIDLLAGKEPLSEDAIKWVKVTEKTIKHIIENQEKEIER
ncbi:MAG: hypothetical protein KAI73_03695 [Rhodospirillaceae bacterium]|nr:hypothetical protein [Rhodospirillaceae bacterium]